MLKEDVRKKDIEINLDIEVPSEFGMMKFFVAARNKRKVNEADLSLAYNQARGKPVLFLTTGTLTKKAEEHLSSILKGAIFKKL